LIRNLT